MSVVREEEIIVKRYIHEAEADEEKDTKMRVKSVLYYADED